MIQNGKRNYQAPSDALTGTNAFGPRGHPTSRTCVQPSQLPHSFQDSTCAKCWKPNGHGSHNIIFQTKFEYGKYWAKRDGSGTNSNRSTDRNIVRSCWRQVVGRLYNKSPYIEWSFGEMKSQYTTKRYFHFAPSSNEFAPWSPNMPSSGKES